MATQFSFYKDAILKFGENFVSDQDRSPLQISYERIGDDARTQRGFLRTYYRADKRTLSTSWSRLPGDSTLTIDGGWGADDLEAFYLATPGLFTVTVTYDMVDASTPVTETIDVVFEDFSKSVSDRKSTPMYQVSLSLQEV